MALPKPSPGLLPAENYARFRAAFDAIDALQGSLAQETTDRTSSTAAIVATLNALSGILADTQARLTQEQTNRSTSDQITAENLILLFSRVDSEAAARAAIGKALDDLRASLVETIALEAAYRMDGDVGARCRPGDTPAAFVAAPVAGLRPGLPALSSDLVDIGDNGSVARLTTEATVSMRVGVAIEANRIYRARWIVQRRVDTRDPSNNAVRLGIAWLDRYRRALSGPSGFSVVKDLRSLKVSDGRQVVSTTFSRFGVGSLTAAPPTAVRAAGFVQKFGGDDAVDIELIDITDITDLASLPDLSSEALAQIGALVSQNLSPRLAAVESATTSPNSLAFATQADAAAAMIPANVTTIQTRGLASAGDGSSGLYKRTTTEIAFTNPSTSFQSQDGAFWLRIESVVDRVQRGQVGPESVSYFGAQRAVTSAVGVGAYDVTFDIIYARSRPGYNGDDAPALNRALLYYTAIQIQPITLNLKTTVYALLRNQKIYCLGGMQAVVWLRDAMHIGSTLVFGDAYDPTKPAGACAIEGGFFVHIGRANYGSGPLPGGKLTGGQCHIEVHGGQRPEIHVGGYGCQHFITYFGGSGIMFDQGFVFGGVWDPANLAAQEGVSHVRLVYSPAHGWPKTSHFRSGEHYGNTSAEARQFTAGNVTLSDRQIIGPQFNFLFESFEDLTVDMGFSAGASVANFGFRPKDNSYIAHNAKINGGWHDEAQGANFLFRRDSDAAPVPTDIDISRVHVNGQYRTRNALVADGTNGRFAARNLNVTESRFTAHLLSQLVLSGVDGGSATGNTFRAANAAGTTDNDISNNACMAIFGMTRSFHRDNNKYGGGANEYDGLEVTAMKYGAVDVTPASQGNTYGPTERPAYTGLRNGVAAINQPGGGFQFGGTKLS